MEKAEQKQSGCMDNFKKGNFGCSQMRKVMQSSGFDCNAMMTMVKSALAAKGAGNCGDPQGSSCCADGADVAADSQTGCCHSKVG